MKKTHIIAVLAIAVAIIIFAVSSSDFSTYSDFATAAKVNDKVKIVGQYCKNKPVDYDPIRDANSFTFFMRDNKGIEKKVTLLAAKPQEFERSEQVVLTGQMHGEEFVANEMLMKCPSKYKDEEIYIKSEKKI
jgi:cytochrome c-type biogenesis protein CcmE